VLTITWTDSKLMRTGLWFAEVKHDVSGSDGDTLPYGGGSCSEKCLKE
jgi:hypothetical protein